MDQFHGGVPGVARSNNCRGLLTALGEARTGVLWLCPSSQGASERAIEMSAFSCSCAGNTRHPTMKLSLKKSKPGSGSGFFDFDDTQQSDRAERQFFFNRIWHCTRWRPTRCLNKTVSSCMVFQLRMFSCRPAFFTVNIMHYDKTRTGPWHTRRSSGLRCMPS